MRMLLVILLTFSACTMATQPKQFISPPIQSCQPDPQQFMPLEQVLVSVEKAFLNGCVHGLAVHIITTEVTPDMFKFCETVYAYVLDPEDPVAIKNFQKLFQL